MRIYYSVILFLFTSVNLFSQIRTSIGFEKDTVDLGELNNLSIEIVTPRPEWVKSYSLINFDEIKPAVSFFPNDSLDKQTVAEFDYLDLNTAQPVLLNSSHFEKRSDGMYVHKNTTRFQAWDVGGFYFPDLNIALDTANNARYNVMPLESNYLIVLPPTNVEIKDSTQILAPISPIILEERDLQDWLWFVYLNLAMIAAGLILYFVLRRKKKVKEIKEPESIIPPAHEIAFEKLDILNQKELWQKGKIKQYQSELTYTIREYLENRFGIQALESTTGEINKSLKEVDFDTKHTAELNNILQIADMVKFAKAKPEESIHEEFMMKARNFVRETLLIEKEDEDGLVE